jgi:hypothetical protein
VYEVILRNGPVSHMADDQIAYDVFISYRQQDPDGGTLASGGPDTVVLWRVDDQGRWRRLAESLRGHADTVGDVANRNLSRAEWEQPLGRTLPYLPAG